jgi:hypothetical protein
MSPDIRELFDQAADDSRRAELDAYALLRRGRRKVRVRRVGAAAGAGVLAAAAVVAVTQFPRPAANGPVPPAETPRITIATPTAARSASTPSPTSPPSTAKPGPPQSGAQTSGAELLRKIPYSQAVRRCHDRMRAEYGAPGTPVPIELGPGESQRNGLYVTDLLRMRLPDGRQLYCSVPGPVRPAYQGSTTGRPGDARAECGRLTWSNLTSWTVAEQRDADGGLAAVLFSNDRTAVLVCDIDAPGATRDKVTAFPDAYVYLIYGPNTKGRAGSGPNGSLGSAPDSTAVHWLGSVKDGRQFWGGGGLAKAGAVRYALFSGARKLTENQVRYGVYALRVWVPAGVAEPDRVVGYDASGRAVEQYQPF